MRSLKFLLFALLGINSVAADESSHSGVAASELKIMQEEQGDEQGEQEADVVQDDNDDWEDDVDDADPASQSEDTPSNRSSGSFFPPLLGILNPAEAKSALTDFWGDVQSQAREFTRNITPSMQIFAQRMQAAGFPAPLVHGFREIEVPAGSLLPQFVPDIPIMGPLNPAGWSQEQINAALNPQVFNLMNPNTVAEIPGLGRFSIAIPPVNVDLPWAGATASPGGGLNSLAASAAGLLPQSIPSFVKYERIPGEAPSHMNFPELGIFNPANAYENKRQLFVAGDILQNSFDRLNEIITGSAAPASGTPSTGGPIQNLLAGTTGGTLGGSSFGNGPLGGFLNYPFLQTAEAGSGLVQGIGQGIGQGLGQGLLEPVFNIVNGSGAGGAVRGILDRTARLASGGMTT